MEDLDKAQPQQIQVEIDEATAKGCYVNLALVAHSETEFFFDFLLLQPQSPKTKVLSRIISSPDDKPTVFLKPRKRLHGLDRRRSGPSLHK